MRNSSAAAAQDQITENGFAQLEAFSRQLSSSLHLETVYQVLADGSLKLLAGDRCAIFARNPINNQMRCVQVRGLTPEYIAAVEAGYWEWPVDGQLWEHFLIIEDAPSDERMAPLWPLLEADPFVTTLFVGLSHQGEALGALVVYYNALRQFDEPYLALAQTLAHHASVAIANAQAYHFAGLRVAELETLRQAAVEINGQPDLESTLAAITSRAASLLNTPGAAIYLYDAERDDLAVRAITGGPETYLGRRMKTGEGLAGCVFQQRQPQIVGDYRSWEYASPVWSDVSFGTVLGVPLLYGDEAIGVLTLNDDTKDRLFDRESMRVAGLFASLAAATLSSALALADSRQRASTLAALQRVAASVTATLDLEIVLQAVVEELRNTFGYSLVSIHRLQGEQLVREAVASTVGQFERGVITGLELGIIGRAVRLGEAQFVTEVASDADFVALQLGIVAEAVLPIELDGRLWGVLNVETADRSTLRRSDVPLLGMFCQQIAVAIRNAGNFAEIQQRVAELEGLRRTHLRLASSLDSGDLLNAIAASVLDLASPQTVHLYVQDIDSEHYLLGLVLPEASLDDAGGGEEWAEELAAQAIQERQPVIIDRVPEHLLSGASHAPDGSVHLARSRAAFPFVRSGGVLGAMAFSYDRPTTISGALERLMLLFADQAASALENARLYQLEARRRQLADTLRQLASAVNSMMGFEQAAATILEYLGRVVTLDSASILVAEEDHLYVAAQVASADTPWPDAINFGRGELLSAERVLATGESVVIPDTARCDTWRHDVGRQGIGAWLGFPITFQGEIFGVLSVDRNQPGSFTLAETQIVKAFADQAAIGLANARLFQAAAQRAAENERLKEFNESLLRSVETGILLEGSDDSIQYVNPPLCSLVGYSEEELVNQPSLILLSAEMNELVERKAAGRRHGEKGRYEAALLHKDGHQVPVLVNATPLFEHGVFIGTLTAFNDITQRKRIEKTLLALNAAAAAVRHATEPRQVYQTIAQEVDKLGLSLVAFSYNAAEQKLRLEQSSLVGKLAAIGEYWKRPSSDIETWVPLSAIPEFAQVLEAGQAQFYAAPIETVGAAALQRLGISAGVMVQTVDRQRAVLAPVMSQQQVNGIFVILGNDLSEEDLPAFEAFANQASAALDNARLLEAERRERERAETLAKVASILNSTSDLAAALPQVLRQMRLIVPCDNSALFLMCDGVLFCQAAEGSHADWWLSKRLPLNDLPIFQEMATDLAAILVSDTASDPRWRGSPTTEHLASWIGAPLTSDGQLVGLLSIDQAQAGFFSAENREMVTAFADQISVAVQRAYHFSDAQQRLRELASLARVSALLNEATDLTEVLDVVLTSFFDLLDTRRGVIALVSGKERARLHVTAARGYEPGFIQRVNAAGLAMPADLTHGPELRPRLVVDPIASPSQPDDYLTRVVLALGSRVIGLIELEQSTLDDTQRRMLAAVAGLAAVAIDKAQLHQDTVRAYEELQDLDRLKDEFVQNVSHELRTPLTFVKGYVEYLLEGYSGQLNESQRQALEIVLDRSNAIIRLVNDIVLFKQAELQKMLVQPVALELIALSCIDGCRMAARQAGIEIELDIFPDLPEVYGDGPRLGQVFDNLLGNAIKFSPDGGRIRVTLRRVDAMVQVAISDTGIGIPADRLVDIWKRFYQVDGATTRRYSGAGLGLPIAKRIIEAHEGTIWVESELNKGSTFYFTLPAVDEYSAGVVSVHTAQAVV